jgi:hypothetical protein
MKRTKLLLIACLFQSVILFCHAFPKQVIIIRHGEKPITGNTLDQRGYERAAALAPFFEYSNTMKPDAIYAMENNSANPSLRPIETCTPTAQALHLPLHTEFSHSEYQALAKSIMSNQAYNGKTVLICWSHGIIPSIASAFGVNPEPNKWPNSVFDQIYLIKFNQQTGKVVSFTILPQKLLYGDSDKVQNYP